MLQQPNIIVLVNPASQNGRGLDIARVAFDALRAEAGEGVRLMLTEAPGHATQLACELGPACDILVAAGGDGLVHEVVNGLMELPASKRPVLAVLPTGSGNDYAASLGMSSDPKTAAHQILTSRAFPVDLGICNGNFFAETLSFGLDAAIALDTIERRKRTGHSGTRLYLEAGMNQLMHHLDAMRFSVDYVDAQGAEHHEEGSSFAFAVQVGPTYGGGFRICPDASLDDGLLDVCIAHAIIGKLKATLVFACAKGGHHRGFKCMQSFQAKSLRITFDCSPAAQIDGEFIDAPVYEISLAPAALEVLYPARG